MLEIIRSLLLPQAMRYLRLSYTCVFYINLFILVTGQVFALKDIWIIGDDFIHDIFGALPTLKLEAKSAKTPQPYLYDNYNVYCFTANPLSDVRNVMTRLVNSFVKALNDATKIPRLVLIVPDEDLFAFIGNETENMRLTCEFVFNWILTQFSRAIEAKKDEFSRRKPGALTVGEPKFIWIKMIKHDLNCAGIECLHHQFNLAMEDCLADRNHHYIMDVSHTLDDASWFDNRGNLNGRGKSHFWRKVDGLIEQFDKQSISLKPIKADSFRSVHRSGHHHMSTSSRSTFLPRIRRHSSVRFRRRGCGRGRGNSFNVHLNCRFFQTPSKQQPRMLHSQPVDDHHEY